jgi:hypothetical protein
MAQSLIPRGRTETKYVYQKYIIIYRDKNDIYATFIEHSTIIKSLFLFANNGYREELIELWSANTVP